MLFWIREFDANSPLGCMSEFPRVPCVWEWSLPISRFPDVRDQIPFDFFLTTSQSLFLNVQCNRPMLPPWAWNVQQGLRLAIFHEIHLTCLLSVPHGGSSDFPQLPPLLFYPLPPHPILLFLCSIQ